MLLKRMFGLLLAVVGFFTVVYVWLTVEAPALASDVDFGMPGAMLVQGGGLVLLVLGATLAWRGTLTLYRPR